MYQVIPFSIVWIQEQSTGTFLISIILFWASNVMTNAHVIFICPLAFDFDAKSPFVFINEKLKSWSLSSNFTTLFQLFATSGGKTFISILFFDCNG